jgi:hypothetical protein
MMGIGSTATAVTATARRPVVGTTFGAWARNATTEIEPTAMDVRTIARELLRRRREVAEAAAGMEAMVAAVVVAAFVRLGRRAATLA